MGPYFGHQWKFLEIYLFIYMYWNLRMLHSTPLECCTEARCMSLQLYRMIERK